MLNSTTACAFALVLLVVIIYAADFAGDECKTRAYVHKAVCQRRDNVPQQERDNVPRVDQQSAAVDQETLQPPEESASSQNVERCSYRISRMISHGNCCDLTCIVLNSPESYDRSVNIIEWYFGQYLVSSSSIERSGYFVEKSFKMVVLGFDTADYETSHWLQQNASGYTVHLSPFVFDIPLEAIRLADQHLLFELAHAFIHQESSDTVTLSYGNILRQQEAEFSCLVKRSAAIHVDSLHLLVTVNLNSEMVVSRSISVISKNPRLVQSVREEYLRLIRWIGNVILA